MKKLLISLSIVLLIAIVLAMKAFIAVAIVSMFIVPLTYLYSLLIGRSYNFVIDQSNILYKMNILGQWSLVICISFLLVKYFYPDFMDISNHLSIK